MNKDEFTKLMMLQNQYRKHFGECENQLLEAIEDFKIKLQNVFTELYPNETPTQLSKMFSSLRYRWLFVPTYVKFDDSWNGCINVKIVETNYTKGDTNVIQEFPLTYQLLTETGRLSLAESWKKHDLIENENLKKQKLKTEREERIKLLEHELSQLRSVDE